MTIAATVFVLLVAALHVYFLVLEMFLWTKPFGLKTFGTTQEHAESSKTLAANQGLYNGFLSAGLVWGLVAYGIEPGRPILTFFLTCVIVAGLYGGATVNKRIIFVQTVPAAIALALVWAAHG
jgi:putative membrane protein